MAQRQKGKREQVWWWEDGGGLASEVESALRCALLGSLRSGFTLTTSRCRVESVNEQACVEQSREV